MNLALGLRRDHGPQHRGAGAMRLAALSRDPGRGEARSRAPSVPAWAESSSIFSVTATATETSVVCAARNVPKKAAHQAAVHGLRGRGTARLLADRDPGRAAGPAGRGRHQRLHAVDVRHRLDPRPGGLRRRAPRRHGDDPGTRSRPPFPPLHPERHHVMSVTTPAGFRAHGVAAGLKSSGAQGRRAGRQRRPAVRLRQRLHRQPLPGQPGALEQGGRQGRRRAGGRAQLRRRQLLHRPRGLPDHARRRRAGRRAGRRSARVDVVVCSTGLIGLANDREALLAGVDAAYGGLSADGGQLTPPRRS